MGVQLNKPPALIHNTGRDRFHCWEPRPGPTPSFEIKSTQRHRQQQQQQQYALPTCNRDDDRWERPDCLVPQNLVKVLLDNLKGITGLVQPNDLERGEFWLTRWCGDSSCCGWRRSLRDKGWAEGTL
jgi:hypothetical protein